jgi:hypothetical protein
VAFFAFMARVRLNTLKVPRATATNCFSPVEATSSSWTSRRGSKPVSRVNSSNFVSFDRRFCSSQ